MAHVLVVDDDPLIREMLRFVLEDAGHFVTEAGDGEEAIEALTEGSPDCVVLDLMMPRVDGFGVLQARQERGIGIDSRTVILSCCSRENDFRRCWELGADEYLTKPVDVDRLVSAVGDLLAATPDELRQRREQGLTQAVTDQRLEASAGRHFLRG